jgi:hypothetical protein
MNYALLLNKEILLSKPETIDLSEDKTRPAKNGILRGTPTFAVDLWDLNIHDNLIAKHFDAIIGSQERELSKQRHRLDQETVTQALANLSHAKFLTAVQLFGMTTQLGQQGVVEQVCGNEGDSKERKKAELHKRVRAILARSNDCMVWTKRMR